MDAHDQDHTWCSRIFRKPGEQRARGVSESDCRERLRRARIPIVGLAALLYAVTACAPADKQSALTDLTVRRLSLSSSMEPAIYWTVVGADRTGDRFVHTASPDGSVAFTIVLFNATNRSLFIRYDPQSPGRFVKVRVRGQDNTHGAQRRIEFRPAQIYMLVNGIPAAQVFDGSLDLTGATWSVPVEWNPQFTHPAGDVPRTDRPYEVEWTVPITLRVTAQQRATTKKLTIPMRIDPPSGD